eukprot:TRINITY_DN3632_c0_g4_i1.p1 TRINITY_DN3632_c0_g4~~TRINITY_DN3632_c0_g4_i1.p1  ORF type:complete len:1062 (+),score=303.00 TRINITY_DN3632_c0_g4_i1:969-4154(+)
MLVGSGKGGGQPRCWPKAPPPLSQGVPNIHLLNLKTAYTLFLQTGQQGPNPGVTAPHWCQFILLDSGQMLTHTYTGAKGVRREGGNMPPARDSCIVLKVQYPVKLIGTVKVSVKEKVSKILREVVQRFPKHFSRKDVVGMRVALMGRLIPNGERLERFKSGDVIMIVKGAEDDMPKCPVHELEMLCYSKKHHYMLCHTCWTVQDHKGVTHCETDQYIVSIGDLPEERRVEVIREARQAFGSTKDSETSGKSQNGCGDTATSPPGGAGKVGDAAPVLDRTRDYRGIPVEIPDAVESSLALDAAQKNIVTAIHQDDKVNVRDKQSMFPLLYAVHNQNEEMVEYLLDKGACPNQRTFTGLTPLMAAAHLGNINIVSKLLRSGNTQPDAQMKDGTTALITAASHPTAAHINILLLLQYDAMANLTKDDGTTALMCSAQINDYYAIKILIRNGASVSARQVNGYSALSIAAMNSNVESVKVLLRFGAPLCTDLKGNTLLALSARHSTPEMVKIFIDQGIDPNQANNNGCTPLALCTSSADDVEIAKLLLAAGARVAKTKNCDLLLHIVLGGHSSKKLLETVWPHATDIDYKALIEAAVEFTDKAMLHFIVDNAPKGASFGTAIVKAFEAQDKLTSTYLVEQCCHPHSLQLAFTWALRVKNTSLMQCLLSNEHLVKPTEERSMTPLMVVAAETGNSKVAKMLLEMGFDKTEVDERGRTALHHCKTHKVAFALLKEPDERLKRLDDDNESALVNAIRNDSFDTVKLLLSLGFDSKTPNVNGDTPLHVAAQHASTSVLRSVLLTYKDTPHRGMVPNGKGHTPLTISCIRGASPHVLEILSELCPSQEVIAEALHAAVEHNKVSAVEKLLAVLKTPIKPFLETCAKGDNVEMMKALLGTWDQDTCSKWDIAEAVLKWDAKKTFEYLIAPLEPLNKLCNEKTFAGETLLHKAARYGSKRCIDLIITNLGIPVESTDNAFRTPLMIAALAGQLQAVQWLVDRHHAKLGSRCKLSRTPAMYSVLSNKPEVLRFFAKPRPKQSKTSFEEQELMNVAITFELEDMVHAIATFPEE